jgi:hypothetical protein
MAEFEPVTSNVAGDSDDTPVIGFEVTVASDMTPQHNPSVLVVFEDTAAGMEVTIDRDTIEPSSFILISSDLLNLMSDESFTQSFRASLVEDLLAQLSCMGNSCTASGLEGFPEFDATDARVARGSLLKAGSDSSSTRTGVDGITVTQEDLDISADVLSESISEFPRLT